LKGRKMYQTLDDIHDIVCRKQFILKFNEKAKNTPDLKIKVPNTVFIEPDFTPE
jgi:hypothetical protein